MKKKERMLKRIMCVRKPGIEGLMRSFIASHSGGPGLTDVFQYGCQRLRDDLTRTRQANLEELVFLPYTVRSHGKLKVKIQKFKNMLGCVW